MANDVDKMHVFNDALAVWREKDKMPFWSDAGEPCLDYDLLLNLLRVPLEQGDSVRSGLFAAALDLWIARELEHAGFKDEMPWPRASEPRAMDPCLANAVRELPDLAANPLQRALRSGGAQANANVMGSVYTKQVDVGMSSWLSGPEVLISTKTMSGSFGKNIANRFEEAYGDVKNLRGRYPLAAHGFFFLARATILDEPSSFEKVVHMLRQLSRDGDVYDAVALLLVDWDLTARVEGDEWASETTVVVPNRAKEVIPRDLLCENFFAKIVDTVLANSPVGAHLPARRQRGLHLR